MCTDHSMVMAWSAAGPALREKHKMPKCGYILGNGDRQGSAGPKATRTSNTTPHNSVSDKAGLAEPRHSGECNNRGVHIKMLIGLS